MQNPTYLTCSRHSVYYFRYPLPKPFHVPGRAKDIKLSLHTKDSKKALHLSRGLAYVADILIEQGAIQGMNYAEIQAVLKKYFSWRLQMLRKGIETNGLLADNSIQAFKDNRDMGIYFLHGEVETLRPVIDRYNLPVEEGSPAYRQFSEEYLRWYDEFATKAIKLNDEYDKIDFDEKQPTPIDATFSAVEEMLTLSELVQHYIDESLRGGRWSENTEKSYRQKLDLLVDLIGASKPCTDITIKDCRTVKETLIKLPKRHSSLRQKGKSITEVINLDLEKLNIKTVNNHIGTYSGLFRWAVNNGYVTVNHFHGLSVRQSKKKEAVRKGFDSEQVKIMLSELTDNKRGLVRKEYQKWGALIGLFTGARVNEIGQLKVEDVREEDGILCFDINELGDSKLKTGASTRLVPVHSKLIELGFLDYLESVKAKGRERLLYELTYDRNNGYGRNLGRWFNTRFLVELSLKSKASVFHSLRHTMFTELLRAGVDLPIAKAVIGHTQEGVGLQVYFERGYKIEQLKEAIEKVHTEV